MLLIAFSNPGVDDTRQEVRPTVRAGEIIARYSIASIENLNWFTLTPREMFRGIFMCF